MKKKLETLKPWKDQVGYLMMRPLKDRAVGNIFSYIIEYGRKEDFQKFGKKQ